LFFFFVSVFARRTWKEKPRAGNSLLKNVKIERTQRRRNEQTERQKAEGRSYEEREKEKREKDAEFHFVLRLPKK